MLIISKLCLLEAHHLEFAKDVLAQKCLVGFVDHFQESIERIMRYFRLNISEKSLECIRGLSGKKKRLNKNVYKSIAPGSKEWDVLAELNSVDVGEF